MIKFFFKSAFRNFYRNRIYTSINILGLSFGLTVSFLLFSWILNELSFDRFYENHDRVYRIVAMNDEEGRAAVSPAVKRLLLNNIPEVEESVRLFRAGFLGSKTKVSYKEKVFTNDEIIYADPEFFKVFPFPMVKGNPETVLRRPDEVILTENAASKYFGDEDPIGKSLLFSDKTLLQVTGIVKNLPSQSHFHFDMLAPMDAYPWGYDISKMDLGSSWAFHTYLKTYPEVRKDVIKEKIEKLLENLESDKYAKNYLNLFQLQPVTDIHLRSSLDAEMESNNDIRYIYLFSTIALLVIIIAGINYVNLTTAYSFDRSREVGIKKILGAYRSQLFLQYLGESVLIAVVSFVIALILIEVFQPMLTTISGTEFEKVYHNIPLLLTLLAFTIITGILSGLIPSVLLSSFKPLHILKTGIGASGSKTGLRKVLVIFQFSISLILLISTGIIYQQLNYIQNKKLGYDKDHVVVLHIGYPELIKNHVRLKNALHSDSRIKSVSAASQLPTNVFTGEYMDYNDEKYLVFYISVDPDFFRTLGVGIISGKENIENLVPENYENRYVINQYAVREVGWEPEAVEGKQIRIRHGNMQPGPVIGVVEDFNFQSLHNPMNPLVFEFVPDNYEYLFVKIDPLNIGSTIEYIKSQWQEVAGDIPFEYSFLDQEYDKLYKAESRTMRLFIVFSVIATLIAMLGLFGLASFAAFKRTKEIGIRKVFGATQVNILKLLSGEFIRLLLIAFIMAIPVSVYFMNIWLEEFAYKVQISYLLIILSGVLVLFLALITVGYHSIQASGTDPVKTLRYE